MRLLNTLKTKNIIKISPDTTLKSAISSLASSHDAAFVFTSKNEYVGVINPYHALIKSAHPGSTKIGHILFHPPRLRIQDPVSRVASLMISSRVHYLPIFDSNNSFSGIISARNMLSQLRDAKEYRISLAALIAHKAGKLLIINMEDSVSHALSIFKKYKHSKIIVVGDGQKVQGVLTYYHLINFLVQPRSREHKGDRIGTKTKLSFQKVKNFMQKNVVKLSGDKPLLDALDSILEHEIGSIVVVDNQSRPIGIVTTTDLLGLLIKPVRAREIELIESGLTSQSHQIVARFLHKFTRGLKKLPGVEKIRLLVAEEKQGKLFRVIASFIPTRGVPKIREESGRDLKQVLKKVEKTPQI